VGAYILNHVVHYSARTGGLQGDRRLSSPTPRLSRFDVDCRSVPAAADIPQMRGYKSDRQLCSNEIRTADDSSGSGSAKHPGHQTTEDRPFIACIAQTQSAHFRFAANSAPKIAAMSCRSPNNPVRAKFNVARPFRSAMHGSWLKSAISGLPLTIRCRHRRSAGSRRSSLLPFPDHNTLLTFSKCGRRVSDSTSSHLLMS
jgi:hypothetical protein